MHCRVTGNAGVKMTDNLAGVEFAGLENDRLENDGLHQYDLTLRCLEFILQTASLLP